MSVYKDLDFYTVNHQLRENQLDYIREKNRKYSLDWRGQRKFNYLLLRDIYIIFSKQSYPRQHFEIACFVQSTVQK